MPDHAILESVDIDPVILERNGFSRRVRFAAGCDRTADIAQGPVRADTVAKVESCNGLNFWREPEARRDR